MQDYQDAKRHHASETQRTLPATGQQVAPQGFSRIAIGFAVTTGGPVFVSTIPLGNGTPGIRVGANTGLVTWFNVRDHGDIVMQPWFAIPTAAGDILTIYEVFG